MVLPCPNCREPAESGSQNPWGPFCSERCKMIDLSRWFDEDYVIPGESVELPDDGSNDSESAT